MTESKMPVPGKKRSALRRRRQAVLIGLVAVVLLAVAFIIVWTLTSRTVYKDFDGVKYSIRQKGGVFVLLDENGNKMPVNEDGNYVTACNTILGVDSSTGEYKIIAMVPVEGSEKLEFNYYNEAYTVLMYPKLDRANIASIRVVNEKDEFTFVRKSDGTFEMQNYSGYAFDSTMFATLVNLTGYTATLARLDLTDPNVAYGFAANGYAEYGLPETEEEAKKYFVITATDGTAHKVLVGNEIPSGAGYYARYAGRDSVYIMKELTESENNSTFAATLLGTREDFITPLAIVPMGSSTYFDVTDFTLTRFTSEGQKQMVKFSYVPIELRYGTYYASFPYVTDGSLAGYGLHSYKADDCLQNLQGMKPLRTVEIQREDEGKTFDEVAFAEKYGVAYMFSFTYNAERGENQDIKTAYPQIVWVSPMTAQGTYYLYESYNFKMVVEVSRSDLEFLEWSSFEWISADVFTGNIAFCNEITFISKTGTQAGLGGVTTAKFTLDNSASSKEVTNGRIDTSKLRVFAEYSGEGIENTRIELANISPFRYFYQTLTYSSLEGDVGEGLSPERMEELRASGDEGADLIIRMKYTIDGEQVERVYRFYHYTERQSFMTLNGNGTFRMQRQRTVKILNDLGRILTNDPNTVINPTAKN